MMHFLISERAVHHLLADVHRKRHTPDKRIDAVIDLDTQYVKLKLLPNETMGMMHRDKLEQRPDMYKHGIENHEGTDIRDEDLISEKAEKFILVRGRAGIGKSTLLQRLVWQWANGVKSANHLKAIFLINLRYIMRVDTEMTLPRLLSLYSVYNTRNADVTVDYDWLKKNQEHIALILGNNFYLKQYRNNKQRNLQVTPRKLFLKPKELA